MASGYDGAMRLLRILLAALLALTVSAAWGRTSSLTATERLAHKQENIGDTISIPGYTNTVRPPSSYTAG
jgi:hypothetical protein